MGKEVIRRARLNAYIMSTGGQAAFVERTGRNQGQISSLQKGKLPFGEKLARRIEKQANLPNGWLDDEGAPLPEDPIDRLEAALQSIEWLDNQVKSGFLLTVKGLRPSSK